MPLGQEPVSTTPHSPSHLRVVIDRLRRSVSVVTGTVMPTGWAANGAITEGDALYVQADSTLDPADASAIATARVVGFARATSSAGAAVTIQTSGTVEYSGWSLTPDTIYYLDTATPGNITSTAPTTVGQAVTVVGIAVSATELALLLNPPILL